MSKIRSTDADATAAAGRRPPSMSDNVVLARSLARSPCEEQPQSSSLLSLSPESGHQWVERGGKALTVAGAEYLLMDLNCSLAHY